MVCSARGALAEVAGDAAITIDPLDEEAIGNGLAELLGDGADASAIVPFRDLFALIFPVTFTLKPFLAKKGHAVEQVDQMHAAWVKSCLLQLTLWSHPYVKDGDF